MIRFIHLFALAAFVAYVSAIGPVCHTHADCPDRNCFHDMVNICVVLGDDGLYEAQCRCVHHKKRAAQCQTTSDCSHLSCPIGQAHACVQHGGSGEKSCVCQ